MEQRFMSVLFLAAMAAVVITCGAELLHLSKTADPAWSSAYGSWFGGAGSFTAVVAALGIAGWQQRVQARDKAASDLKKRKIILYRVRRHFMQVSMSTGPLTQEDYIAFFTAYALRDQKDAMRRALTPIGLDMPRLSLDELTYVDEVSLDIYAFYDRIDLHFAHVDSMSSTNDEDAFSSSVEMMVANARAMRAEAIDITQAARKALSVIDSSKKW